MLRDQVDPVEPDPLEPFLPRLGEPCLAWARSPTMVKLRDGRRRSNICHSGPVKRIDDRPQLHNWKIGGLFISLLGC